MSKDDLSKLQEQAALETQRKAEQLARRKKLERAEQEDSKVRYCGESGGDFSNRQWAEQIAKYLDAVKEVPDWWCRFENLRPKDDDSAWNVALSIYQLCNKAEIDAASKRLDECDAIGQSWARASITFALKQALPDAIAREPLPPDSKGPASFHLLAFELLGIEGLPLPRCNWHLKEGQDGFDDPYLDDQDYQTLCNIVCERVPGMTVQSWRESTRGQRIALMQQAIQRGAGQDSCRNPAKRDTDVGHEDSGNALIGRLDSIPPGSANAGCYHQLIAEILKRLFAPDLTGMTIEREINEGRKRIDICFDNAATSGFFHDLKVGHQIKCPVIFVECKNYSNDPANPELDQLQGRFGRQRGEFGILVCREVGDRKTLILRCRDIVSSGRGYVIVLTDNEIRTLWHLRTTSKDGEFHQSLRGKMNELIL